ncbi:DUF6415 family natural product biosynthesis protein [Streptomyces olindensis]|uniref:DUF6415 family natural product biosynthesis protein n=1 Tax=Streptomyces olindensis TaxID=358823 RepID=UPI0036814632
MAEATAQDVDPSTALESLRAAVDQDAPAPPDLAVMRETIQTALDSESGPHPMPSDDELATLTAALRSHLSVLGPRVAEAAERLPKNCPTRAAALACVGEARGKLRAPERNFAPLAGSVMYARRLARVLAALCEHHETVSAGVAETPEQRAFERLADHCLRCPACRTVDDDGANARLPCEEEATLYEEYRRARAGAAAARRVTHGRLGAPV